MMHRAKHMEFVLVWSSPNADLLRKCETFNARQTNIYESTEIHLKTLLASNGESK